MSQTLIDYSLTQESDQIYLREVVRVDVASGTAKAMASDALATLGATYAIGNARYGSTVKVYQRGVRHVEGVHWDVTVESRTEQFDDIITNGASGTVVDKGLSVESETMLRDRSPTGALWTIGQWRRERYITEPRAAIWFEVVHDAASVVKARATRFVGAVNSSTFLGSTQLTWLCNSIETNTIRTDSGQRYLSRYSFAYKPDSWNWKSAVYLWNSRTSTAITAATSASNTFTVFRTEAFSTLGFTF